MQKLLSIVALLAVMFFASSGFNGASGTLAEGSQAPEISVNNDYASFDLADCRGEYVLLTFWSSADAMSRIGCNTYSAWFAGHPQNNVRHIAINFDNVPDLFDEIVRLDNLDPQAQYNVSGAEAARISTDYGLGQGFGSVLINPDGFVTAFNPTANDLSSLI